ncbi:serine/threonine protein kinase [Nocardia sp. NEAU-G5]|uniref:non-specific serine/threonine protein kinase n=1 Tax=Nocardia albiluteola TaxID=2842303 RepID=A0ABS6AVF2_9NOCA|nr:serine/threonine-protein kinase [Nocardia albiluteola]MBU3062017.1 serine/threonine protein kinase [Nocardia albiluteola]
MTSDRLIAGRYRLGDPIGSGAMGVVWRASDVRLRRTVAVKQLLLAPGLTRAQALEAKMRAMREGRIAARLHHPNAVTVFDVAEEDGQPWLVMEFVDAPSLATLMREKGQLDPQEVARIGAKVAAALAAAHDAGIVHRDVKPANILVADGGAVKITDFGISRAVGDVTVTSTGFLAGTPAYLSPEVARGENPESPSDVFALGSTLYAAVEGQPPFGEAENPLAVLHAVAAARIPEPQRAGPLGPVLMRLLASEAGDRPTMVEAQQELEAVAEGRAPAPVKSATRILPKADMTTGDADATTVLESGAAAAGATVHLPAGGAAPAGSTVAQPKPGAPGNRRVLILAAAGVVVLLVVIGLVVALRGGGGSSPVAAGTSHPQAASAGVVQIGAAPSTQAASTTRASSSTATTTATSTTAPSSTTTAPPAQPADLGGFITSYYGRLPGNTNGAWSMLSPGYQAQTGSYDQYTSFWNGISSVGISNVKQDSPGHATATVTYTLKNGSTTSETRWFTVDSSAGRMQISGSGT